MFSQMLVYYSIKNYPIIILFSHYHNPILDSIRRDRGLYDFRVTVSSSPEDLDRNTLTGKIYLKPTRALEFIDIEFLITPTGASFENI